MKFFRIAATLAAVCLLGSSSFATFQPPQDDPSEIVSKSLQVLNKTQSWQSDFVQTRSVGGNKTLKRGRIYYSRPGKVALRYAEPEEIQVSIDGNRVTAFYPARKLAQQISVPFPGNLAEILQFPDGMMAATLLYDIGRAAGQSSQHHAIEFTPRLAFPLEPNLEKFRIDYHKQSYLPVGLWLYNREGDWMQYEFVNAQVDKPIDANVFRVKPPPGTNTADVKDLRELVTGLFIARR